jgi:WD40 repeat protein
MNRKQLQACRRQLYGRLPLIGGWLRRKAAHALARERSVESVRLLAEAVASSDDPRVRELARDALRQLTNPRHIETVATVWLETRHAELTRLLGECSWLTQAPLRVQVLHALGRDRRDPLEGAEARVIEPLLLACGDADPEVARRAREVLGKLKTPEGREALCRRALQPGEGTAREVALAAGYAPREPGPRALFYFLTGQWDAYEALDFDQSLLRAAYQAADEEMRRQIASQARVVGRVEWVEVVTGGLRRVRLGAMTDAEWQVTADVLEARAAWPELWQLAQQAPPPWAARLLVRLRVSDWRPANGAAFVQAVRLAEGWGNPDLASLVRERGGLTGHAEPVTALAFSPAALAASRWLLVSADEAGKGRLWALPEGELLREWELHPVAMAALAISSDGKLLVTGARDSSVRLWKLPDGRPLRTLREENHMASALALAPDGRLLAAGLYDWTVCLWDLAQGRPLTRVRGHTGPVNGVVMTPDGRLLASASMDGTIRLWDLPGGHFRRMLLPGEWVTSLAVSPDGLTLASGGYDRAIRLWQLPSGDVGKRLEGHTADVTCLGMGPDGRVLASGGQDRTLRLWGLPAGRGLRVLEGHTGIPSCLAISPDGRLLASAGKDRTVRLWDLRSLRLAHVPAGQLNAQDLAWVEETVRGGAAPPGERAALEFVAALIRARLRFEIELGEGPGRIRAGEFDIEIMS